MIKMPLALFPAEFNQLPSSGPVSSDPTHHWEAAPCLYR